MSLEQQHIRTRLDNVINCTASGEWLCQTCMLLLHVARIHMHFITQGARACQQLKPNDSPVTEWPCETTCGAGDRQEMMWEDAFFFFFNSTCKVKQHRVRV